VENKQVKWTLVELLVEVGNKGVKWEPQVENKQVKWTWERKKQRFLFRKWFAVCCGVKTFFLIFFLLCVMDFTMIFRCLFLDKDTCDGSGRETEYVWGTFVKWNPKSL
jgi:hypothetical protein